MIEFRAYQSDIIERGAKILLQFNLLYLAMEVRTGKTFTSLGICQKVNVKNVLFITKKKAISSILSDYEKLAPDFELTAINYESVHKLPHNNFDLIIIDEAHSLGAFPKPSKRTIKIKALVGCNRVIFLSGTPTPESWSQIYHQFWVSVYTPFPGRSFYAWSKIFVDVKKIMVAHGNMVNDYSHARIDLIKPLIQPLMISITQEQAGFSTQVAEEILEVEMMPFTYALTRILKKDLVYVGKNGGVILCDTPVKLMQKIHQLFSGTVKLEDGSAVTLDKSKAEFIKQHFKGSKIAIFYVFKEELKLLQEVFEETLCTDLEEFNSTSKNIALQIVSGREGISLKAAKYLVMYNIDFSATSYWQGRDRLTTKDRTHNKMYWIFSRGGLEKQIHKTVMGKKSYTTKHFNLNT